MPKCAYLLGQCSDEVWKWAHCLIYLPGCTNAAMKPQWCATHINEKSQLLIIILMALEVKEGFYMIDKIEFCQQLRVNYVKKNMERYTH
jgi:hypothetical protein